MRTKKTVDGILQTDYLIDPANPTGYAQVLEEWTYDVTTPASPVVRSAVYYMLGDDVIAQTRAEDNSGTWTVYDTEYFLYDGHGSTRQLARPDKSVIDSYSYDGYGVMLSNGSGADAASNAATSLLYCGEQYDSALDQYYLRARYYNPHNGLFNRIDPYSGNLQDPQSLHKYLYCHNNPINGIDPLGLFTQFFGYAAELEIQGIYSFDHIGDNISLGKWSMLGNSGHSAYKLKPDVLNYSRKTWLEIKPFTYKGIMSAQYVYLQYYLAFRPFGYRPETNSIPSTQVVTVCGLPVYFWNAAGVVFYTDYPELGDEFVKISSVAAALAFMQTTLGRQILVGATLKAAPRMAIAAKRIDHQRLQRYTGIAAMLAIGFGML